MAADSWRVAFVLIQASSCIIFAEFLSWWTGTERALWCLGASIAAARLGASAVIVVTVNAFVRATGAVRVVVTDLAKRDADVRDMLSRTPSLVIRTGFLNGLAGVLDALVTSISTVVLTVTDIGLEDTLGHVGSVALEVSGLAVNFATGVGLITGILTVRGTVAVACTLALELLFLVALVWRDGGAAELIA